MWRLGVCVVLALLLDSSLADTKLYPVHQLQRLKRAPSPYYNNYCPPGPPGPPPFRPPGPPPFWPPPPPLWPPPPPPPPPYGWPPGPPPYARQQDYAQNQFQDAGQSQAQSQAQSQSQSQSQSINSNALKNEVEHLDHQDLKQGDKAPCDSCGDKNSAVSNAESDSGTAVAIAIARVKTKKEE